MGEIDKKREWFLCPFVHPEVYELYQIICEKPTEECLVSLVDCMKDEVNFLRRVDSRSLFLYYVAKCNVNKRLKNDFLNKLTNGRKDFSLFASIVVECMQQLLSDFDVEKCLSYSKNSPYLLPVINTFYQMCYEKDHAKLLEVVNEMLPMYKVICDAFVNQLNEGFGERYNIKEEDLVSFTSHTMKQVLWIFVRTPDSNISDYVLSFLDCTYEMLRSDKVSTDVKTKCGLIFVHSLKNLPAEEVEQFHFKQNPMLELTIEPEDREKWLCGNSFQYACIMHIESVRVALYAALFNSVLIADQLRYILIDGKTLFHGILHEMLCCVERPMDQITQMVEISKNLLLIGEHLYEASVPLLSLLFGRCLEYVSAFCEYHVEIVQKNASLFLGHVVRTGCQHYKDGVDIFVKHLLSVVNLKEGRRRVDFILVMYLCKNMKCSFLLRKIPRLREQVWELIEDPVYYDHARATYELLMKEHYDEVPQDEWLLIWVTPVLIQLRKTEKSKVHIYEKMIFRAFQTNQDILKDLFPNKYMGNPREWSILMKCLGVARNAKTFMDLGGYDTNVYWWGLIEKNKLKLFAVHRDDHVRVSALRVVIECQRTTEYFTEWEFSYLIDFYNLNASNQVPQIRKDIVSLYKAGITRYFASLTVVKRHIETIVKKQEQKQSEDNEAWINNFTKLERGYLKFMYQFIKILITNISPDSNYHRRNSALELLMTIHSHITPETWADYWTSDDIENLKYILKDSYEINKKMAFALLSHFSSKKLRFELEDAEYYGSFFEEALALATDIKPSKSLSAAYMFQLCCYSDILFESTDNLPNYSRNNEMVLNIIILLISELLGKVNKDETENADEAGFNTPYYGLLQCMRYLIRYRQKTVWNATYAATYSLIFSVCQRISKVVLPIVSNPAPEGYLPEDSDTEINIKDDTVKSQKILVYAWRTVKEITLMYSEFVSQDIKQIENKVLSTDEYVAIGEFFIDLFIQAKHRGVFEQAYVGFCVICGHYWKSADVKLNSLPAKWLRRGLDLVTGKEQDDRLCSTRRSAGMPFLIVAILTTDPSDDQASFHNTMSELSVSAGNEEESSIEFRIHALNILRFLIRHAQLGDQIATYIESSGLLAMKGMETLDWGVRNSSTMLFSAIVTRLFGVQRTQDSEELSVKNKMTVKVFSTRFPKLFDYLVVNLKAECENKNSLVLHPILLVFSRLYPSHLDPSDTKIEEAMPYIKKCLGSPSYETRKLAARASISMVFVSDLYLTVRNNFNKIETRKVGNNECHGLLLEVWYILQLLGDQVDLQVGKIVGGSMYIIEHAGTRFSHHCVALYLDILTYLYAKYDEQVNLGILKLILTSISRLMGEQSINITGRQNFEAAMVNLTVTVLLSRLEHVAKTYQAINFDFENYMVAHERLIMKTYCLHFMWYMNLSYNELDIVDSPLYIFSEMVPPDAVKNVIDNFSKPTMCEFLTNTHKFMVKYLKAELERMNSARVDDSFILNLQILAYYPCILVNWNNSDKKKTLELLINFCSCDKEEVISAVITCISVLLSHLDHEVLKSIDYKRLIRLLRRSAAPDAATHRRFSVCQFLLKCKFLYYPGTKFMNSISVIHFFNIIMTLLEDESMKIRNEISGVTDGENVVLVDEQSKTGWSCNPDKSRYDLMKHICRTMPKTIVVGFLFSWCVRHFPDASSDSSDVFERSEANSYAENVPLLQTAGKTLSALLWVLPYNLSYEDKSIFIEEQCQVMTTILLDAFSQNSFQIVLPKTKVSVICAFRSILTYFDLHPISCNFKVSFTEYFRKKILSYFQKHICKKDYDSVKKIFLTLYQPVLLESELN